MAMFSTAAARPSLLGWITQLGNGLFDGIGIPRVFSLVIWFVASLWVVGLALRGLLKLLALASPTIAVPLAGLAGLLGGSLLFFDYLVSRLMVKRSIKPPDLFYVAGDAVQSATIWTQDAIRAAARRSGVLGKIPTWVVVAAVLLMVGAWNQTTCATPGSPCVSPISNWQHSMSAWFSPAKPAPRSPVPQSPAPKSPVPTKR